MTVEQLVRNYRNKVNEIEIYEWVNQRKYRKKVLSSEITSIDESEVEDFRLCNPADWEVMDEDRYSETIMSGTCCYADFDEWYDDKDAKVLVIILEDDWREDTCSGIYGAPKINVGNKKVLGDFLRLGGTLTYYEDSHMLCKLTGAERKEYYNRLAEEGQTMTDFYREFTIESLVQFGFSEWEAKSLYYYDEDVARLADGLERSLR